GNVWLDAEKTSPYKFYQFWLNTSDEDAESYIKIFTFKTQEEVEQLIVSHNEAPHERQLQKALAESLMLLVHNQEALDTAITASSILFGKADVTALNKLSARDMQEVFDGVPSFELESSLLAKGINLVEFFAEHTSILKSNGEARRAIKENSLSINKAKVNDSSTITSADVLSSGYILAQRGKKNYFLVELK
ncbi:MAG: tyrosyl-tRNA synthetase, partial [Flavobacteriaceae bacterium]